MATRSVIGYIREDGSYLGTYCHYDGYPSSVGVTLLQMSPEDIKIIVLQGIVKGGLRSLGKGSLNDVEYFNEVWSEARRDTIPGGEEYTYILGLDGNWTCLNRQGNDIPPDTWPLS